MDGPVSITVHRLKVCFEFTRDSFDRNTCVCPNMRLTHTTHPQNLANFLSVFGIRASWKGDHIVMSSGDVWP